VVVWKFLDGSIKAQRPEARLGFGYKAMLRLSGLSPCMGKSFVLRILTASKLDFIQLRGIANRIHEAFEQCTRNLYHVGRL
jgi:hypothetical protein